MTALESPATSGQVGAGAPAPRPFTVDTRLVLSIAVPMTFAYLSVPLIGLVDTAVIGQLGEAALIGGIAVGAIIFDIVFTTFNFLRAGTTALTAQAMGADDAPEQQAVLARGLLLALAAGVGTIAVQWPILQFGLLLMDVEGAVAAATRDYFSVRIWAAPFALINFVLVAWLMGLARAGWVLLLTTLYGLANVVLSIWFVLGLGWGVTGVAAASVLAEVFGMLVAFGIVAKLLPSGGRPSWSSVLARVPFVRLIVLNRDIMIRSFALLFSFAFLTRQGASQGAVILAANAVLMQFFFAGSYFLDGLATAAEQLSGRALGARWGPAFDRAVRLSLLWGFVIGGLLSLLLLIGGRPAIDLLTTAPDVRAAAYAYLPWAALTPLVGVAAFQFDGIFIGATWSRDMRNMMLLSLALFVAATWLLMPLMGNHGLWLAFVLFLASRGLGLGLRLPVRRRGAFSSDPAVEVRATGL